MNRVHRVGLLPMFSVLVIFCSLPASAATITATSCELSAAQAAVNAATDGDTVLIPAGTCTWNAALQIVNKTIIIQGAGSGAGGTTILYGGTGHTLVNIEADAKRGRMDVSGFRFVGGDPNYWNGTALQFWGPKGWKNLRIHHNVFDGNEQWTIKGYSGTHGLIDHNTFQGSAFGIMLYGDGAEDWATPLLLGMADFFFIEDNIFDWNDFYGVTGSPVIDMDDGGRQVFRNNTIRYGIWETHDKARSGLVSANAYEIYNNTFSTTTNKWKALDISAGTGVVWGNTFSGDWTVPIGGMDYKSFDPRTVRLCDGTDPADQNTPGQSGWRCQYQIGSMGEGPSAIGYPLYTWSNTKNGILVGMVCTDGCNHLQSGRDFINNGNTPKPGYAPYTYPHPLATGQLPPPSLSVSDVTVAEGATANFTINLSAPSAQTVTVVAATANGNATAGSDYTARTGVTVTFPAGTTQQVFTVTTLSDGTLESAETFTVNLSGAVNATIADGQGIGNITDAGPPAPPNISTHPTSRTAGVGQTATFSVSATGTAPLSYQWKRNGVNISGATSASYTTAVLALADNGSTYSVTVSNSLGSVTSNSATLTVTALPGPVASYNFDEGTGATLNDRSGNGNHGTVANGTWNSVGKTGGSLTFNGTSTMVTVADASALDFTTGMTIEAWVYPTTQSGWRTVVLKETTGQLSYALYSSNDSANANTYIGTAHADATAALPINTWTHLASTYDGTTLRLFVNGAQVGSVASGSIVPSAGSLRIGGNSVWGEYFAGRIDDVRVYNRALAASEILSDMNNPVGGGGTPPPLPALSISDITVAEGGTASFTVTLSAASTQTVTVLAGTANGTATAGSDYTARSGVTITFPAGSTTQTLAVATLTDATTEGNETFTVTLTSATNATIADAQGIGTITNVVPPGVCP